jgi:hypothetical protein
MTIVLSTDEAAEMLACELMRRMNLRALPVVHVDVHASGDVEISAEVPAPERDLRDGRT